MKIYEQVVKLPYIWIARKVTDNFGQGLVKNTLKVGHTMTNPTWNGHACQIQSCEKQSCQMFHGWCDRGNTTGEVIALAILGKLLSPPPSDSGNHTEKAKTPS